MATQAGLERAAAWTAAALDNPRAFLSDHRIAIAVMDIANAEGFDTVEAFLWRLTQEDSLLLNLNDCVGRGGATKQHPVKGGTFLMQILCDFIPTPTEEAKGE